MANKFNFVNQWLALATFYGNATKFCAETICDRILENQPLCHI